MKLICQRGRVLRTHTRALSVRIVKTHLLEFRHLADPAVVGTLGRVTIINRPPLLTLFLSQILVLPRSPSLAFHRLCGIGPILRLVARHAVAVALRSRAAPIGGRLWAQVPRRGYQLRRVADF